jgi:hypothetical protein
VERFYADPDGVPPWNGIDSIDIAAFRVTLADAASGPTGAPAATGAPTATGQRAAALKRCKKRARKHDWSHKRLKKCKKKANSLPI